MASNRGAGLLVCACLAGLQGCATAGPAPANVAPGRANPAAEACLRDGYVLQPVLSDGVPVDYTCVEPHSGERCPEWAYFRRECRLPRPAPRQDPRLAPE